MPNEKNLIPFDQRTEEEQRDIRSAGGKASGVSRRRNRQADDHGHLVVYVLRINAASGNFIPHFPVRNREGKV